MDLEVKEFNADVAQPPRRMTDGAVGFDFWAEEIIKETSRDIWYRTGYGVRIPDGYFGDLRARSSVSETGLVLANGAGVIDPDYRGEVQFRFYKVYGDPTKPEISAPTAVQPYKPGDRIGQMLIVPVRSREFETKVVEEFSDETDRGEGGFGST